jgi:hypothetical protein
MTGNNLGVFMQRLTNVKWVALLLAAGVLLRVGAALWLPVEPVSDFKRYANVATELARTGSLSYQGIPFIFQPPAYPIFLGVIFKCFGIKLINGVIANLAISIASIFIFRATLTRMHFNQRAQLWALGIFALYPGLTLYVPILGTETLSVFFVCVALFFSTSVSLVHRIGLGGTLALLALSRPQFLPVVLVIIVYNLFFYERDSRYSVLGILIAFCFVLTPWMIRNAYMVGEPVLVSINSGYVALVNNNPANNSGTWMPLSKVILSDQYRDAYVQSGSYYLFEEGSESEKTFRWTPNDNRLAFRAAAEWVYQNPTLFLRLALHRFWNTFVQGAESLLYWPLRQNHPDNRMVTVCTNAFTLVVVCWAMMAIVVFPRLMLEQPILLAAAIMALTVAAVLVFEGQGRYVIPMIPCAALIIASWVSHRPSNKRTYALMMP